jgi:HSP20 family protein
MVEKSANDPFWPSIFDPLRALGTRVANWFSPAAEASEGEGAYRIALEVPGVAEEDIHLSIDQGVVTVRGEKRTSREERGETWFFSERQFGSFSRSFRLPPDADEGGIAARLSEGVLEITLPRRILPEAEGRARRIPITSG